MADQRDTDPLAGETAGPKTIPCADAVMYWKRDLWKLASDVAWEEAETAGIDTRRA